MKSILTVSIMSAGMMLMFSNSAMAWFTHNANCSPGYWKNHVHLWDSVVPNCVGNECNPNPYLERACCTGEVMPESGVTDCDFLLEALQAQGNDPLFSYRAGAKHHLDSCFPIRTGHPEDNPCPDED